MLGVAINTLHVDPAKRLPAPSQYMGLAFDSICVFGDQLIGGNDSGIFTFEGKSDNGTAISWHVKIGKHDFRNQNEKRFRSFLIGGKFYENVKVTCTADEDGPEKTTHYKIQTPQVSEKFCSVHIPWERSMQARYWSIKIEGSGTTPVGKIDEILGYPVIMPTKRPGYY